MRTPVNTPLESTRRQDISLPQLRCQRLEKLLALKSDSPPAVSHKSGMATLPTSRRSGPRPMTMRQATVKGPSALHEVYTSDAATMSRSKSRIQLVLRDDPVIQRPKSVDGADTQQISATPCPAEFCELTEKLKTQVADLSLFLEEERLMHKDTKRRAEEMMRDRVTELKSDHKAALQRQQNSYEVDIETLKTQYEHQLLNERLELSSTIAKLKTEMEILSGAFHTFKSQTEVNHNGELKEKEERLTSTLKLENEVELKELENLLRYDHNIEINRLEQNQLHKLSELKQDHKKQCEAIRKRYTNHESDIQELQATRDKLTSVVAELEEVSKAANTHEQQLFEMNMKYSDSRAVIAAHEMQTEEKVKALETKYKERIDKLLETNVIVRQQYLRKCEELFDLSAKAETDKMMVEPGDSPEVRAPHVRLSMTPQIPRGCRLARSQSLLQLASQPAAHTKSLFTQLHVCNLNDELQWRLDSINHNPVKTVYQVPMSRVYENLVIPPYESCVPSYYVRSVQGSCRQNTKNEDSRGI